jgi:hypothetical protein
VPANSALNFKCFEEISGITGGLPINYGDVNSSIIRIKKKEEEVPEEESSEK